MSFVVWKSQVVWAFGWSRNEKHDTSHLDEKSAFRTNGLLVTGTTIYRTADDATNNLPSTKRLQAVDS
jgi:hypothetical protein